MDGGGKIVVGGVLCLNFRTIDDGNVESIIRELIENPDIRELHMWRTAISDANQAAVFAAANESTLLTGLHLGGSTVPERCLQMIASGANGKRSLRSLSITSADLGDEHVTFLEGILKNCANLESISICYNRVSELGILALATACRERDRRIELDVYDNCSVGDSVAAQVEEMQYNARLIVKGLTKRSEWTTRIECQIKHTPRGCGI